MTEPVTDGTPQRSSLYQLLAIGGLVATVVLLIVLPQRGAARSGANGAHTEQTEGFREPGGSEAFYARDAGTVIRSDDWILATAAVPTPDPASYEYPRFDDHPPWADPHPAVQPGDGGTPEVFTLWMFVFNYPDRCTDGTCDIDDIGIDTTARGGVFQVDGLLGDRAELVFGGRVRLGQEPANGATLENPRGAEIHLAIAPHGMALSGAARWRQLNGPIGSPRYWWAAMFPAPDGQ